MKNLLLILPIALVLILFTACDPDDFTLGNSGVYGIVQEETTQRPISGASVFINGPDNQSTVTDINGNYRFENMPLGEYTLNAQKERYTTTNLNVSLSVASFEQVDIPMLSTMLSTNLLEFGSNINELALIVTNSLDVKANIEVDENQPWLTTDYYRFGIDPGQSKTIKFKVFRPLFQQDSYSVPIVINLEEDFGFEILESRTITLNAQR